MTLPDYPLHFWIITTVAIIILGIDKAGFGGGVGIVSTPLIALTIPVPEAAALMLPILIVIDLVSLRHYYRLYDQRSILILLPGAIVGIALGALLFDYFSEHAEVLRVSVGWLAILFVCFQASRALIAGALEKTRPPAMLGGVLGVLAGVGSALIHAGGPFALIYLLPQQLPRATFVGTTVVLFALMNWIKLIPYAYLGLLHWGRLTTILLFTPLAFLSVWLGIWLNSRFSNTWFQRLVYTLLLLTGVQLIVS